MTRTTAARPPTRQPRRSRCRFPTPPAALRRIGIKLALKKSQVRAGEANTGGSTADSQSRLQHRSLVQALSQLGGRRCGRAADRRAAAQAERSARKPACGRPTNPSQTGPANEKLRMQVVNLRGTVSRLPKPFARMVSEIVEEFEGEEAGSSKAQMNARSPTSPNSASGWSPTNIRLRASPRGNAQIGEFAAAVRAERHAGQVLRRLSRADHRHERPRLGLARRHAARQGAIRRHAAAIPACCRDPQRLLPATADRPPTSS